MLPNQLPYLLAKLGSTKFCVQNSSKDTMSKIEYLGILHKDKIGNVMVLATQSNRCSFFQALIGRRAHDIY